MRLIESLITVFLLKPEASRSSRYMKSNLIKRPNIIKRTRYRTVYFVVSSMQGSTTKPPFPRQIGKHTRNAMTGSSRVF